MIESAKRDLRMNQGSRFVLPVLVTEDGAIKDLSGYTARMQIREFADSATTLGDYTTVNGKISISGPSGRVTVQVPSAETAGYSWGDAQYDLEIVDPQGEATRIMQGKISLSREVTR